MTRAPPLSGRRHIFVTFAAAVSLWRFSVCAFVGLRIEGSMNACMELVGFSTSNKVKNHWQWFLTWVRSNPRGSVSQFQGFGGLVHPTRMIRDVTLCLAIIGCS